MEEKHQFLIAGIVFGALAGYMFAKHQAAKQDISTLIDKAKLDATQSSYSKYSQSCEDAVLQAHRDMADFLKRGVDAQMVHPNVYEIFVSDAA